MLKPIDFPDYVFGGDSSRWDDSDETPSIHPDFQKSYTLGWRFNYLKASQGLFTDRYYRIHLAICKFVPNLLLGAYHFLVWDISPEKQAEFFWNTIKDDGLVLPLVVDFEWWSTIPSNAFDILYRFLEALKKLCGKRKIMIYTAYSFWKQYGKTDLYWKQYMIWLAKYSNYPPLIVGTEVPKPWDHADFWQFTGVGDGIYYGMESKGVDLDFYMGTMNQLLALCDLPIEPIPDPDPINPPAEEDMKMIVVSDSLRIRSTPDSDIANILPNFKVKGDIVNVYDIGGRKSSWVKISKDKNEWCCVQNLYGDYLKLQE